MQVVAFSNERSARDEDNVMLYSSDLLGSEPKPAPEIAVGSIATDGTYVYVYNRSGLMRVGSGRNGTVKGNVYIPTTTCVFLCCLTDHENMHVSGHVYAFNKDFSVLKNADHEMKRGQLIVAHGMLFFASPSFYLKDGFKQQYDDATYAGLRLCMHLIMLTAVV